MKPTIKCGKHLAEHANISGSKFHDVNLSGSDFDDVNLSKTKLHNINLSDIQVSAAQIGGATFRHIGPPPDKNGQQARQRPVTFEEAMLCDSTFRKVDMSNVKFIDCNLAGMTINEILVTDLLVASSAHPPREGLPPIPVRERAFIPTELALLCRLAGMSALNVWGGTAGNWRRGMLNLDEIEIMVVARKTAESADAGNA